VLNNHKMGPTIPLILQWREDLYPDALTGLNQAHDQPPLLKSAGNFAASRSRPIG
jgi:hypothetical protein